jgi:hypothetical protein
MGKASTSSAQVGKKVIGWEFLLPITHYSLPITHQKDYWGLPADFGITIYISLLAEQSL